MSQTEWMKEETTMNEQQAKDKIIGDRLRFDPLAHAERTTGQSYKEDEATSMLGFGIHLDHTRKVEGLLLDSDDTTLSNDLPRYQRIVGEEGFRLALETSFKGRDTTETHFVYFHEKDAILLGFDTFGGNHVNGGKFYYNWRPDPGVNQFALTSSGCMMDDGTGGSVWAGDHDCRQALRYHIRQLRLNGSFVSPWVAEPSIWLFHHGITNEARGMGIRSACKFYDQKRQELIGRLPDWVRSKIRP